MKRLFADTRRRNLAVLGAVTLVFVVLAIVSTMQNETSLAPKEAPHAFFPDLKNHLDEVAAIHVESKAGKFTVRHDAKGWVVAEKGGFPADESAVRQTAVAMAELEAVEPKTANPEMLGYTGLGDPAKGGDAVQVTLTDSTGHTLAAILIGHNDQTTDATGRSGIYVRKPGDNQTWLARGFLVAKPDAGDWLDKRVLTVARERIKETSVTPAMGDAYTVTRDKKDDPDFGLSEMPAGRELIDATAPDAVATAIVGFTFDDAQPAGNFDFGRASRVNTTTFDGLTIAVKIAQQGEAYWAAILAAGSTTETLAEAATINAQTGGWAYRLPAYRAKLFLTPLESLLKPQGGNSGPAPAPDQQ